MDEYSLDYDFPINKICIDKVELSIGKWNLSGDPGSIFNFYEYLGHKAAHTHQPRAFAHKRVSLYKPKYSLDTLSFASKSPVRAGRPLFSGKLFAEGSDVVGLLEDESQYSMLFKLKLNLNLTRFMRYQALEPERSPDGTTATGYRLPQQCSAVRPPNVVLPRTRETALDGSHNFLPRQSAYLDDWDTAMRRYVLAIESYMNTELVNSNQCSIGAPLDSLHTPEYRLDYIELYWELHTDSPLMRVPEIANRIREHFNSTSETLYPITTSTEHSSQTIRADLRSGVKLRIYAKTTKRIRIEVGINYHDCQSLRISPSGSSRAVCSLDGLISGIGQSAGYAQDTLSTLWESIRQTEEEPAQAASTLEFISAFYAAFEGNRRAGTFLQQLVANRGIPRRGLSSKDVASLSKLVRKNMLVYRGRPSSRYSLASAYEAVYELT